MQLGAALPTRTTLEAAVLSIGLLASACADDGPTTLRIAAGGDAFVEERIPADVVADGWEIDFTRFLVSLGEVEVDGEPLAGAFVVDLAEGSSGRGHALGTLTLPSGGRPMLGYRLAPLAPETDAADDDVQQLVDASASMWVEGSASKDGRTVTFSWLFDTDVRYDECESSTELLGGETVQSRLSLRAEQLFWDDLDPAKAQVSFDFVAAADRNDDGEVEILELWETSLAEAERYDVGERDIVDLWQFIEAQAEGLGHVDGDGACERAPADAAM